MVAALTAVVGLLIARGIFNVTVVEPKGGGVWGSASTVTYAVAAAIAALLATALMHLLFLAVPSPGTFFSWIMVLLTAIAVVVPLTLNVNESAKIATAAINLVIGLVITIVVHSMAARARTVRKRPTGGPPPGQYHQQQPGQYQQQPGQHYGSSDPRYGSSDPRYGSSDPPTQRYERPPGSPYDG